MRRGPVAKGFLGIPGRQFGRIATDPTIGAVLRRKRQQTMRHDYQRAARDKDVARRRLSIAIPPIYLGGSIHRKKLHYYAPPNNLSKTPISKSGSTKSLLPLNRASVAALPVC